MSEKGSANQHKQWAEEQIETVKLAIVTVSDSRTPETDTNYHYLAPAIAEIGHEICGYRIIKDEPELVVSALDDFAGEANIILFNGGTGGS